MTSIYITFQDKEFKELKKRKGKRSWKTFIIEDTDPNCAICGRCVEYD